MRSPRQVILIVILIPAAALLCLACGSDDGPSGGSIEGLQQSEYAVALERCRCDLTFGDGDVAAANADACAQQAVGSSETPEEMSCANRAAQSDPMSSSLLNCIISLNREIAACYRTNTACTEDGWDACWEGKDDDACFEMYPLAQSTRDQIDMCYGTSDEEF